MNTAARPVTVETPVSASYDVAVPGFGRGSSGGGSEVPGLENGGLGTRVVANAGGCRPDPIHVIGGCGGEWPMTALADSKLAINEEARARG